MSCVGRKNTRPEMIVRKFLHSHGYRFRLHVKNIPGTPDLVFTKRRKIIFIHGCFWHRHPQCGRLPKSNKRFWLDKLEQNRKRDLSNLRKLRRNGWKVLVIWEFQLSTLLLADKIISFLGEK